MNIVKQKRMEQGLTPTQLAANVGVSEQTILRLERLESKDDFKYIRFQTILKLCDVLDLPLNFFAQSNC